jgi:hypothetical protein
VYSDWIECPQCNSKLEVAPGARTFASLLGLAAAAIAWRLSSNFGGSLSGVLPTLCAFLAFGIVSPLTLMFTANLRNASPLPSLEPVPNAGGHGGVHH